MKVEPAVGQKWRNRRNGTLVTITGWVDHNSRKRGDWDYSVQYVSERGRDGQSFYPNFHGRFELIEQGTILPVDVALTKPLDEWPTDFLNRLVDAANQVIQARHV